MPLNIHLSCQYLQLWERVVLKIKDLFEPGNGVTSTELVYYIVGAVVAGVVGFICIKTLLVAYNRKKMKYFSYYCFVAGTVAIVTYFVTMG